MTAFLVDSLDDVVESDGDLTLREALQAANTNRAVHDAPAGTASGVDSISFEPSLFGDKPATILLDGGRLEVSDDLDILGPSSESLWIDADRRSRVFYVTAGTEVLISDLTVTGGLAEDTDPVDDDERTGQGGGIFNDRGTLSLFDVALQINEATHAGGGAYSDRGTLAVEGSAVWGNVVLQSGAGIFSEGGTVTVVDSTFSGNFAGAHGSGIFSSGDLTVSNSEFTDSSANTGSGIGNAGTLAVTGTKFSGNSGSAIDNQLGTATVTNSLFESNRALGRHGAGIFNAAEITVTRSTFVGNSADFAGGIYNNQGTVTLVNSVLAANSAAREGGAVFNHRGTMAIVSSTVAGNYAEDEGGGILNNDASLTLTNSIVANNVAGTGADIAGQMTPESQFNLVGADPMFLRTPGPGPDGRWGSADDDFGELALLPDSPAIDAGNNALLPADAFDLDGDGDTAERLPIGMAGNPRVMAGRAAGSETVDMGAFEKNPYHNDVEPLDVDGDGHVAPLDALLIFNLMNAGDSGPLPVPTGPVVWFLDTNNDGVLSPIDALLIINELNARSAEGEPIGQTPAAEERTRPDTPSDDLSGVEVAGSVSGASAADHVMAESPLPTSLWIDKLAARR